jgi:hypothetical protein
MTNPQKRVGANATKKVPAEVVAQLEAGTLQTANLMEGLVIDLRTLANNVGIAVPTLSSTGIVKRMREVAGHIDDAQRFVSHPSDTVRGFAAFAIGTHATLGIEQKLTQMKVLAAAITSSRISTTRCVFWHHGRATSTTTCADSPPRRRVRAACGVHTSTF